MTNQNEFLANKLSDVTYKLSMAAQTKKDSDFIDVITHNGREYSCEITREQYLEDAIFRAVEEITMITHVDIEWGNDDESN